VRTEGTHMPRRKTGVRCAWKAVNLLAIQTSSHKSHVFQSLEPGVAEDWDLRVTCAIEVRSKMVYEVFDL
jgi:hypothetical protein